MLALLETKGIRYEGSQVGPYRVLHAFEPRRALRSADVDAVRTAPASDGNESAAAAQAAGKTSELEKRN